MCPVIDWRIISSYPSLEHTDCSIVWCSSTEFPHKASSIWWLCPTWASSLGPRWCGHRRKLWQPWWTSNSRTSWLKYSLSTLTRSLIVLVNIIFSVSQSGFITNFFIYFFLKKFLFLANKQAAEYFCCVVHLDFFWTLDISAASRRKCPSSSTSEPAWFTQEPGYLSVHRAQEAPQPLHPNSVPGRCRKWVPKQCLSPHIIVP